MQAIKRRSQAFEGCETIRLFPFMQSGSVQFLFRQSFLRKQELSAWLLSRSAIHYRHIWMSHSIKCLSTVQLAHSWKSAWRKPVQSILNWNTAEKKKKENCIQNCADAHSETHKKINRKAERLVDEWSLEGIQIWSGGHINHNKMNNEKNKMRVLACSWNSLIVTSGGLWVQRNSLEKRVSA